MPPGRSGAAAQKQFSEAPCRREIFPGADRAKHPGRGMTELRVRIPVRNAPVRTPSAPRQRRARDRTPIDHGTRGPADPMVPADRPTDRLRRRRNPERA